MDWAKWAEIAANAYMAREDQKRKNQPSSTRGFTPAPEIGGWGGAQDLMARIRTPFQSTAPYRPGGQFNPGSSPADLGQSEYLQNLISSIDPSQVQQNMAGINPSIPDMSNLGGGNVNFGGVLRPGVGQGMVPNVNMPGGTLADLGQAGREMPSWLRGMLSGVAGPIGPVANFGYDAWRAFQNRGK
jgi:hypothetical protein